MCLLPSHFAKRHYHDCGWVNGYIGQLPRDMILIMVRGRWYHRSIAKSKQGKSQSTYPCQQVDIVIRIVAES